MTHDFDSAVDRRGSNSIKWDKYETDILPLWVADMDFRTPEPILKAMHTRIDHGVFGYQPDDPELREIVAGRMQRLYNWDVGADEVLIVPGLVVALTLAARTVGKPGDSVIVQTPVYHPFLLAPPVVEREVIRAPLVEVVGSDPIRYTVDFEAFEAALRPDTRLFILCNPHNPVGHMFSSDELARFGEIAERHDLIICSDEIHSELLLDGQEHVPLATVAPEIAERTITLIAPSKTFNVPGLTCGFAIIQNETLREQYRKNQLFNLPFVNSIGTAAARAAFSECDDWLADLRVYLRENRDFTYAYLHEHFPGIRASLPPATYLMWIDFRALDLPQAPGQFFLEEGRVALNEGTIFGDEGAGFARLNFATQRDTLTAALNRLLAAVQVRSM